MAKIKLKPSIYLNLAVSIFTGVFAQLFMKYGMSGLKKNIHLTVIGSDASSGLFLKIIKILFIIFTNKFVIIGIVLYLISMFFWISVLSKIDLSAAYPFVSIGVILTVILAAITLHESIPLLRWIGIFITLSGVYLIVSSHQDNNDNNA
ncbi:MAG: SMR family transporter [Deltaproteobacteria bacterium]|jgi:drug/metabolite transporter (DMT)-like permease|nr:SMR family transporter [Deltaproteobacteria bacterium]MCL5880120.1 SMR family transporter [Deltaproteobacteria bacterium]MDA8304830.1 SMR family transporter [Deltaproteobacteria bacterium]